MSASPARREWEAARDWIRFTTGLLGNAVVTDSAKMLLASGLSPNIREHARDEREIIISFDGVSNTGKLR